MTRDDLEQLDTRSLRALARQRLAAQARSLRTRASLLAALTRTLAPSGAQGAPVAQLPPRPRQPGRAGTATPGAAVGQPPTSAASPPPPVAVRGALRPQPVHTPPAAGLAEELPIEEGFFLAQQAPRPAGRPLLQAAADDRRPLAPPAEVRPPPSEEVPHLLARDPTTLFLFWDFRRDLERGAAFGLNAPCVLFRLYDDEVLVRSIEAPLGRRSLYLEGLLPGHLYSVEAWLAGSDGHARPTGRRSAPVRLAPAVPSSQLEVQLVRVPHTQPLGAGHPSAEPAGPGAERFAAPGRLELPASLDWRGGQGPGAPGSGRP